MQEFRNITMQGVVEAKLYLEDHGWDAQKALAAWRDDNEWESKALVAAGAAAASSAAKEAEAEADAAGVAPKEFGQKAADIELPPFPPTQPGQATQVI